MGGPDFAHEFEEIRQFVGFDSGYVAVERTVGSDGQWASRVWFSEDGAEWRVLTNFDPESSVRALASNGRQVVAFVVGLDYAVTAWQTADGLNWTTESIADPFSTTPAAAWPSANGWHAAMIEEYEGCEGPYECFRGALWSSDDGLTWRRVGVIPGDPSMIAGGVVAPDGTIVVSSDNLLRSADGGEYWRRIRLPNECFSSYMPQLVSPTSITDRVLIYGGRQRVCTSSPDLRDWHAVRLPTDSPLEPSRSWLVETPFGVFATAQVDCSEAPCRSPIREQFLSTDGVTWSVLHGPSAELTGVPELAVADGPAGVIGLARVHYAPRAISVWRLVPTP